MAVNSVLMNNKTKDLFGYKETNNIYSASIQIEEKLNTGELIFFSTPDSVGVFGNNNNNFSTCYCFINCLSSIVYASFDRNLSEYKIYI